MRVGVWAVIVGLFVGMLTSTARANAPAVEWESAMDTFFHADNGTVRLGDYVIAFAPDGEIKGEVAVLGPDKKVRARFPFFAEPRARSGVFARVDVQGPAEVQLTEPGIYNLIFVVAGKPVTIFPFVMNAGSSGDPFNPGKTFVFDGLWRNWAHLTMRELNTQPVPRLSFWVGGLDLPKDAKQDMFQATLYRDGKPVANTRKSQGNIEAGHYKRTTIDLFHPHADREANPKPYLLSDWLVDGPHEVRVTRRSDDKTLRSFTFTVADGKITPHPRTALDFDPHLNHITPRVAKKGVNVFQMTEAIWIESK